GIRGFHVTGVQTCALPILSAFDGGYATLFTATVADDSTLTAGMFYSGRSGVRTWTAYQDPTAELPDANSLTYLAEGYEKLDFTRSEERRVGTEWRPTLGAW